MVAVERVLVVVALEDLALDDLGDLAALGRSVAAGLGEHRLDHRAAEANLATMS